MVLPGMKDKVSVRFEAGGAAARRVGERRMILRLIGFMSSLRDTNAPFQTPTSHRLAGSQGIDESPNANQQACLCRDHTSIQGQTA
jgi:hypothetical protein